MDFAPAARDDHFALPRRKRSRHDVKTQRLVCASKIGCFGSRVENSKEQQFERKPIMSCRIERVVIEEGHVILCISGRIKEEDVDTLRGCLEQERDAVAIDLKDILLVDREAVRFLASLESTGTELRNCPAYIREWITRERAGKNELEAT